MNSVALWNRQTNMDKKSPTRLKKVFLAAGSFVAVSAFQAVASSSGNPTVQLIAAAGASLYCAAFLAAAYRLDKPTYFDWANSLYFGVAVVFLLTLPVTAAAFYSRYAVTAMYGFLFGACLFPPLVGMDPFTMYYAKKTTPRDSWGNPIFNRINFIMTYVWAGLFMVGALVSLFPSPFTQYLIPAVVFIGFGVPFTKRFPDYYLKRLGLPTLAEQRKTARQKPKDEAVAPTGLPSSAWEAISKMPLVFNPQKAEGLSAVIAFEVTGSETFNACLHIHDGTCSLLDSPPGGPDLTIVAPAEVWLAIARREMDGQSAFMKQAYTVRGNLGILMRMQTMFGGRPSPAAPSRDIEEEAKDTKENTKKYEAKGALSALPSSPSDKQNKENTMKVLAINSSPRSESQSKTTWMLSHLVQGMREAGAEVEVVELRRKEVKNCIGCFTCWTKTPGVCMHADDMANELFPKWLKADIAVYATPLYHFTITASMKAFIERTVPIMEPFMVRKGENTGHPFRSKAPKAVVLSVAGFPEMTVFDQLSSYMRFLYGRRLGGLMAEIYRPAAESMANDPESGVTKDILDATVQAGRELIQKGAVSPETMGRVTQPVYNDFERMARIANAFWKTCIAEKITPKEFAKQGMIPRPDSVETYMDILSMGFNPQKAGDAKAVLQFSFSGAVSGECYFTIQGGTIQASPGKADKPDLTIEAPFDVWMDVITKKADGQQMFMQQKYTAKGDLTILMRMNQLFGK